MQDYSLGTTYFKLDTILMKKKRSGARWSIKIEKGQCCHFVTKTFEKVRVFTACLFCFCVENLTVQQKEDEYRKLL